MVLSRGRIILLATFLVVLERQSEAADLMLRNGYPASIWLTVEQTGAFGIPLSKTSGCIRSNHSASVPVETAERVEVNIRSELKSQPDCGGYTLHDTDTTQNFRWGLGKFFWTLLPQQDWHATYWADHSVTGHTDPMSLLGSPDGIVTIFSNLKGSNGERMVVSESATLEYYDPIKRTQQWDHYNTGGGEIFINRETRRLLAPIYFPLFLTAHGVAIQDVEFETIYYSVWTRACGPRCALRPYYDSRENLNVIGGGNAPGTTVGTWNWGGGSDNETWDIAYVQDAHGRSFAVFGDMPYYATPQDEPNETRTDAQILQDEIYPALRDLPEIEFAVHLGDIGRPPSDTTLPENSSCSAEYRKRRAADFGSLNKPVFYTPGDNDWTDCARDNVPPRWRTDPRANLQSVREILLPDAGQKSTLARNYNYEFHQVYPENQIWTHRDMLFVSLHVVGSCNGVGVDETEVVSRMKYNSSWLDYATSKVLYSDTIKSLILVSHVDVPANNKECAGSPSTGYASFMDQISEIGDVLKGKPVLFVHGDTADHCMDQPFASTNVWRLNAPGDYHAVDADIVTFDPDNRANPFTVSGIRFPGVKLQACPVP
jgi:hypothetical protein